MGDKFEQTERFKDGLRIRKEVLGDAYVDKALEGVSSLVELNHERADYMTDQQSHAEVASTVYHRRMVQVGSPWLDSEAKIIVEYCDPDDIESKY